MRARTGTVFGGLIISHNLNDNENPVNFEIDDYPESVSQPLDYDDVALIIKTLQSFVREARRAGKC